VNKTQIASLLAGTMATAILGFAAPVMAQNATMSSNASWLTSEFNSRYQSRLQLAEDIARIHMRSQYPSVIVSDMMGQEQMTAEDREQFLTAIDPVFASAAERASNELKSKVQQYGWDGLSQAGSYVMGLAFDIVIESPDEAFRRASLTAFEPLARDEIINPYTFAFFYDDVMVTNGEAQRWGTQGQCMNGRWEIAPVEDQANLDARRQHIGMSSLADTITEESEYCAAN
tara:strand:+ start:26414 stop:27103 length:690 start_codon:yes stop_codon:yes gene_type:complete